jgi:hypothetical protein
MVFALGDRVVKGANHGTVEGVFGSSLWILVDGQSTPTTVADDGTVVLEVPLVFEVGKKYQQPGGVGPVFHIVYQIDTDNFVAWFQSATGGYQTTIAIPAQRLQVVEV